MVVAGAGAWSGSATGVSPEEGASSCASSRLGLAQTDTPDTATAVAKEKRRQQAQQQLREFYAARDREIEARKRANRAFRPPAPAMNVGASYCDMIHSVQHQEGETTASSARTAASIITTTTPGTSSWSMNPGFLSPEHVHEPTVSGAGGSSSSCNSSDSVPAADIVASIGSSAATKNCNPQPIEQLPDTTSTGYPDPESDPRDREPHKIKEGGGAPNFLDAAAGNPMMAKVLLQSMGFQGYDLTPQDFGLAGAAGGPDSRLAQ